MRPGPAANERPYANADWTANPCFGCGPENPHGLKLLFRQEEGRAVARFRPGEVHQSWAGTLHGGLLATLLDEALSWALLLHDIWVQTAKLTVRYRRPAPVDRMLVVTGELVRDRGRSVVAQGRVTDEAGTVYAEAQGLFFRMRPEQREVLQRRYGLV